METKKNTQYHFAKFELDSIFDMNSYSLDDGFSTREVSEEWLIGTLIDELVKFIKPNFPYVERTDSDDHPLCFVSQHEIFIHELTDFVNCIRDNRDSLKESIENTSNRMEFTELRDGFKTLYEYHKLKTNLSQKVAEAPKDKRPKI